MELVKHEGNGRGGKNAVEGVKPNSPSAIAPLQSRFIFNYTNVSPSPALSLGRRLDLGFFWSQQLSETHSIIGAPLLNLVEPSGVVPSPLGRVLANHQWKSNNGEDGLIVLTLLSIRYRLSEIGRSIRSRSSRRKLLLSPSLDLSPGKQWRRRWGQRLQRIQL